MKKLFLSILVLISANAGIAQDYPSLLYRVTSPESNEASFIFGTMHVSDSSIVAMADDLLNYIDSTVVFCNEIDLTDNQPDQSMFTNMVFASQAERDSIYSAEDQALITEFADKKMPGMGQMMLTLKPFWVMATIVEMDMQIDANQVLDVQLQVAAESLGKLVRPLETLESQMGAINEVPLKEQRDMLVDYLNDYENQTDLSGKMTEAYINKDLDGVYAVYTSNAFGNEMEKQLVFERNVEMTEKLVEIHKINPFFCAVGALHLPGKGGMIELLEEAGFTVEPVILN
ncbi:TraB/GumN family protein [Sanyastnella coralliicola]|uniref:TraB/GumN family protein n=1 Tax=Sanyastnella coralliicola TaxID=3069118 RepID=UPI0027B9CCAE|nr:TraB/GumN family protein [Longitalea sp. SCSIO 12813]